MNKNTANYNLVAYCGIYCPKCYRMRVSGAARTLKQELKAAKIKGASYWDDASQSFKNFLDQLIALHCSKFCRAGGGSKCKIKKCCVGKNLKGCWECVDFESCKMLKSQFISHCHKIKKIGIERYAQDCARH